MVGRPFRGDRHIFPDRRKHDNETVRERVAAGLDDAGQTLSQIVCNVRGDSDMAVVRVAFATTICQTVGATRF
jgi:hypothetical protein